MKTKLLISLLILLLPLVSNATHIRGGYISYTVDPEYSFKRNFRLTIASDDASQADDPTVRIDMGDGNTVTVPKIEHIPYDDNSSIEVYEWSHIYLQYGSYTVSWIGINRNPNIINIPQPSDQTTHYIYTNVEIGPGELNRNSVSTVLPPKAVAFTGELFKMNLIAYDADGDDLTYEFVPSYHRDYASGEIGPVPGYQFPAGLTINKFGELRWLNPPIKGEYSLSVKVTEHRSGQAMGYTVVDFQIIVTDRTREPRVTLLNKDRLTINGDGSIVARANEKLKLEFYVENTSNSAEPLPVTQFSDLDTLDLATPALSARDSANGKAVTIELTPESFLVRNTAYTIGVRAGILGPYRYSLANYYGWGFANIVVEAQQPTSAPESEEFNALVVYPNPVQNRFTIEAPDRPNLSWQLYDITGKMVNKLALKPGTNSTERPAGLPAGFYTYRISSNREILKSGKLILE